LCPFFVDHYIFNDWWIENTHNVRSKLNLIWVDFPEISGRHFMGKVISRNMDMTRPVLTIKATNGSGLPFVADSWSNQPVTFEATCGFRNGGSAIIGGEKVYEKYPIDSLAVSISNLFPLGMQVGTTTYTYPGPDPATSYSQSVDVEEEGFNLATATCLGSTGVMSMQFFPVNIDTIPPTIEAVLNPMPNANHWNNSDVTITFNCEDDDSGIDECPEPVTVTSSQIVVKEVTDKAGNTNTVEVNVKIDKTPPNVTAPADSTIEATGPLTNNPFAASSSEGLTPTANPTGPFPLGTHTILWSATDAAGNTGTAVQALTVVDTTPPAVAAPADITVEATGPLTPVNLGAAVANDLVDGALATSANITGPFAVGVHTIVWSATDAVGNTGTSVQTVTVTDTTPPVVTAPVVPDTEATSECSASVTFAAMTTDLVDPNPSITYSPKNPGDIFPLGSTTVTATATDNMGNSASVSFDVTVVDTTPPDVSVLATEDSLWPPNHKMVDVGFSYEVTDVCDAGMDISLTATSDEPAATAPNAGGGKHAPDAEITDDERVLTRAERSENGDGRVYVITATATDVAGNSGSASAVVKVNNTRQIEAIDSGQNYDPTEVN
jgi:HYR domain